MSHSYQHKSLTENVVNNGQVSYNVLATRTTHDTGKLSLTSNQIVRGGCLAWFGDYF